jgi:hypothetical protein
MTHEELREAKSKLQGEYLRYYRKPRELLTIREMAAVWHIKNREKIEIPEYPENLTENELLDFIYLRACMYLNVKPFGHFEGSAKICAEIMTAGGNIVDMYRAGAGAEYASLLSTSLNLDKEIQKKIVEEHIPF